MGVKLHQVRKIWQARPLKSFEIQTHNLPKTLLTLSNNKKDYNCPRIIINQKTTFSRLRRCKTCVHGDIILQTFTLSADGLPAQFRPIAALLFGVRSALPSPARRVPV